MNPTWEATKFAGILLEYAEICWNSKPDAFRRIRTHPGRIRDASGIGTSSAEICIWPIDRLLAPAAALGLPAALRDLRDEDQVDAGLALVDELPPKKLRQGPKWSHELGRVVQRFGPMGQQLNEGHHLVQGEMVLHLSHSSHDCERQIKRTPRGSVRRESGDQSEYRFALRSPELIRLGLLRHLIQNKRAELGRRDAQNLS